MTKPERPGTDVLTLEKIPEGYAEACAEARYAPLFLEQNRFEQHLMDNDIPIYDADKVDAYLRDYCKFLDDRDGVGPERYVAERTKYFEAHGSFDFRQAYQEWTFDWLAVPSTYNDHPEAETYSDKIPANILHRMQVVRRFARSGFSRCEISFHISQVRLTTKVVDPDPFLRVHYAGKFYVIGVWDEPGFDAVID